MNLSPEQLACFESPVKASIIAALRALGPLSVREMANLTGGSAGSLYHHIRRLQKVDLIKVAEIRPAGTKPEAVYEMASPVYFMRGETEDQEYRESVFRAAKNITRLAQRHYQDALDNLPRNPDLEEAMRFSFVSARLSQENVATLKTKMQELLSWALATNDPDGDPVIFVGLLAPTGYKVKK
jgi:DNA-binding transcriptional ArsR family regulator